MVDWKSLIGGLPMRGSVNFGFCDGAGRTAPDSQVSCNAIAYLTASANIGVAPSSLATNV